MAVDGAGGQGRQPQALRHLGRRLAQHRPGAGAVRLLLGAVRPQQVRVGINPAFQLIGQRGAVELVNNPGCAGGGQDLRRRQAGNPPLFRGLPLAGHSVEHCAGNIAQQGMGHHPDIRKHAGHRGVYRGGPAAFQQAERLPAQHGFVIPHSGAARLATGGEQRHKHLGGDGDIRNRPGGGRLLQGWKEYPSFSKFRHPVFTSCKELVPII